MKHPNIKLKTRYYDTIKKDFNHENPRGEDYRTSLHTPHDLQKHSKIRNALAIMNGADNEIRSILHDYILTNQDRLKQYIKIVQSRGDNNYDNIVTNARELEEMPRHLSSTDKYLFQAVLSHIHNKKMLRNNYGYEPRYGVDYILRRNVTEFKKLTRSYLDNTKPSWWGFGAGSDAGLIKDYIKNNNHDMKNDIGYFSTRYQSKHINLTVEDFNKHPLISKDKYFLSKNIEWYTDKNGKSVGEGSYEKENSHFGRVLLTFPVTYANMMNKYRDPDKYSGDVTFPFVVENKIVRSLKFIRNVYDIDCYKATWWQRGKHSWDYRIEEGYIGVKGDTSGTCSSIAYIKDVVRRKIGKDVAKELSNVDW